MCELVYCVLRASSFYCTTEAYSQDWEGGCLTGAKGECGSIWHIEFPVYYLENPGVH